VNGDPQRAADQLLAAATGAPDEASARKPSAPDAAGSAAEHASTPQVGMPFTGTLCVGFLSSDSVHVLSEGHLSADMPPLVSRFGGLAWAWSASLEGLTSAKIDYAAFMLDDIGFHVC
jgi:hypothetical protein